MRMQLTRPRGRVGGRKGKIDVLRGPHDSRCNGDVRDARRDVRDIGVAASRKWTSVLGSHRAVACSFRINGRIRVASAARKEGAAGTLGWGTEGGRCKDNNGRRI